jgi:catalase (peroxidase I)
MMVRLAWHASGTFDKSDKSGGSDGATMRFPPEKNDDANAGLDIPRTILTQVNKKNPQYSIGDVWCVTGASAIEFCGGPNVPVNLGRVDITEAGKYSIPPNGRLPDAAQGAAHLRDVFYRQGFNDQEIVALSGAHTLGSCHMQRSGFDGPWTTQPLKFDNEYFSNLLCKKWVARKWDGPLQYQDEETGLLMMLPSDMALVDDESFRPWVKKYAQDEKLFFEDFSKAFAKLLANGTKAATAPLASTVAASKAKTNPFLKPDDPFSSKGKDPSSRFREAAMHGRIEQLKNAAKDADCLALEATSGRSALHKVQ